MSTSLIVRLGRSAALLRAALGGESTMRAAARPTLTASTACRPQQHRPVCSWGGRQSSTSCGLDAHARSSSSSAAAAGSSAAGPAAAAGSAAPACSAIGPETTVASAVQAACERLGRPYASEAVEALEDNWYATAAELAALPDDTARSLGVPLRLRAAVAELLQEQQQQHSAGGDGPWAEGSLNQVKSAAAGSAAVQPGEQRRQQQGSGEPAGSAEGQQERQQQPNTAEAEEQLEAGSISLQDAVQQAVAQAVAAAAWEDVSLPIEERRCPPTQRFGNAFSEAPKVSSRSKAQRYALSDAEVSESLQAEFEAFHRFLTVRFFGAQSEPISQVTALKYADHLRGALGYLHRERGVPLEELSFSQLLPSSSREGVAPVFDYVLWLASTRHISDRTEGFVVRAACAAAKFLFHSESKINPGRGEKAYSDLEVVKELRGMANLATKRAKVAPRQSDEELKWLSWPEYLDLVHELRRECAGRDSTGRRRSDTAVAWSLQRYLIFAILSCVPDRQRTLRELEVGRTLVQDREGRWVIRHGPQDYKTGRSYGERPPLVISPHLYPELEAFMGKWRACLGPRHSMLFTQQNGEPLSEKSLYKLFWTTSFRLTGKKTNPHLVRDMIVTHLRGSGASERELEALAIYMGHSVEMQRDTYDRRTKEQKVEPAVELLAALNARASAVGSASSASDSEA